MLKLRRLEGVSPRSSHGLARGLRERLNTEGKHRQGISHRASDGNSKERFQAAVAVAPQTRLGATRSHFENMVTRSISTRLRRLYAVEMMRPYPPRVRTAALLLPLLFLGAFTPASAMSPEERR